jgi:hypothetical protein
VRRGFSKLLSKRCAFKYYTRSSESQMSTAATDTVSYVATDPSRLTIKHQSNRDGPIKHSRTCYRSGAMRLQFTSAFDPARRLTSLDLDVGCSDRHPPLFSFLPNELAKGGRRARDHRAS